MSLEEFVAKWSGKPCDFDGSYGNQCVDLYRMYCKEVLNIPQTPPVAGAKDIWNSCPGFEKIPNSPDNFPLPGDVMIWGSKYGPYGHVAIVTKADINTFTCFSQNDPTGTLPGLKTYKAWSSLLGWLRPVKQVTQPPSDQSQRIADLEKEILEKNTHISSYVEQVVGWEKKYNECNTQRTEAETTAKGFRDQYNQFVAKLASILGTRQEVPEILAAVDTCITFEDKASELDRQMAIQAKEYQDTIDDLTKEISSLKTKLASLEERIINLQKPSIQTTSLLDTILVWLKLK